MTQPRRPNIVRFVLLGIALLAIAAVVVGLAAGGDDDEAGVTTEPVESAAVEVDGDALAPFAKAGEDIARGVAAPTLTGETFGGASITIPGDGPAIVVFLAHWCPHCQREVPVIVDWLAENGSPDGVAMYGVATEIDPSQPNYPPSAWLAREHWDVPTLVDDRESSAAVAYGLSAFPYFVVLDADGDVVTRTSGELTIEQLEQLVVAARTG
jgi:thiol-disulfide isomerase/thioredoxin